MTYRTNYPTKNVREQIAQIRCWLHTSEGWSTETGGCMSRLCWDALTSVMTRYQCTLINLLLALHSWTPWIHRHTRWANKVTHFGGIWVYVLVRCIIFAMSVYSRIIFIKWRRSSSADVNKFCFYVNKLLFRHDWINYRWTLFDSHSACRETLGFRNNMKMLSNK